MPGGITGLENVDFTLLVEKIVKRCAPIQYTTYKAGISDNDNYVSRAAFAHSVAKIDKLRKDVNNIVIAIYAENYRICSSNDPPGDKQAEEGPSAQPS